MPEDEGEEEPQDKGIQIEDEPMAGKSSVLATPVGVGCESEAEEAADDNDAYADCEAAEMLEASFVPAIVAQTTHVPIDEQLKQNVAAGRWTDVKQLLPQAAGTLEFVGGFFSPRILTVWWCY